jgi:GNAT superfamily N-acetyltransferase
MQVREFNAATDRVAVEQCVSELQEFSRARDPRLPAGSSISTEYLESLFRRCHTHSGRLFVAEQEGQITGYVCVLSRVPTAEPADGLKDEAQVVDLVVTEEARGNGVGPRLLEAAEAFAVSRGAKCLRVQVFAWNSDALSFYKRVGFSEFEVTLEKQLASSESSEALYLPKEGA